MKEAGANNEDDYVKAEVVKDQVQNDGGASMSEKKANISNQFDLNSGSLLPVASEKTNKDQISQTTTIESIVCDQTSMLDSETSTIGKSSIFVVFHLRGIESITNQK